MGKPCAVDQKNSKGWFSLVTELELEWTPNNGVVIGIKKPMETQYQESHSRFTTISTDYDAHSATENQP